MENEKFIGSTIIIGAVIGGFVLLIAYIVRLFKADTKQNERSLAGKASEQQQQQQLRQKQKKEHQHQQGHAASGTASSVKNKKKTADSRWIGRSDKQTFAHPWLLTSLKGHTGQVLDMDFSSNGKYLASCAEEEPDPGGDQGASSCSSSSSSSSSSCSSSSDCNKENSEPSSAAPSPRTTKGLSRRQRKNRRRDDSSPPENTNTKKKPKPKRSDQFLHHSNNSNNHGSNNNNISSSNHCISKRSMPPPHVSLKQFVKLNISERDLASFLRAYLLSPEQMLTMGYPVESSLHPGKAIIFKSPISVPSYSFSDYRHAKIDVNKSRFDVNAREFVPGRRGSNGGCVDYAHIKAEWNASHHDSGNGSSGSSSDLDDGEDGGGSEASNTTTSSSSDSNISSSNFTKPDDDCDTSSSVANKLVNKIKECDLHGGDVGEERKCVRCGKGFYVGSDNEYVTQEKCQYHWGKLRNVTGRHTKNLDNDNSEYACCRGKSDSRGCTTGKFHVWNGLAIGFNGPFDLYVRTRPRKTPPPDGNYGVYALDCEMCYTAQGLELTKITVIGVDGRLVYDCFVKPECEIVDYNTRFSGITAKDLCKKGTTKTLREVQNDLMGFINADTILIGHGLENDLRALRIMHSTVIDTAVTFPHYNGLPYRRSLKSLTSCFLKREIQQSGHGHNSNEDARACMELMLWRVRKDFRSILDHYHHQ